MSDSKGSVNSDNNGDNSSIGDRSQSAPESKNSSAGERPRAISHAMRSVSSLPASPWVEISRKFHVHSKFRVLKWIRYFVLDFSKFQLQNILWILITLGKYRHLQKHFHETLNCHDTTSWHLTPLFMTSYDVSHSYRQRPTLNSAHSSTHLISPRSRTVFNDLISDNIQTSPRRNIVSPPLPFEMPEVKADGTTEVKFRGIFLGVYRNFSRFLCIFSIFWWIEKRYNI